MRLVLIAGLWTCLAFGNVAQAQNATPVQDSAAVGQADSTPLVEEQTGSVAPEETEGEATARQRQFIACASPENDDSRWWQSRWGTSGDYLQRLGRCIYAKTPSSDEAMRLTLLEDIYIKSWSFALINKIAFWLSIGFGILVILWPSLASVLAKEVSEADEAAKKAAQETSATDDVEDPDTSSASAAKPETAKEPSFLRRLLTSPSAQTSVTALAALSFAIYANYKEKQTASEDLMRRALYSEQIDQTLVTEILDEMLEIDRGFQFSSQIGVPEANGG